MTTIQTTRPIQALSNSSFLPKIKHWLLVFIVALTPSLVSYFLIRAHGYQVTDYLPNFSDEVANWGQINTFREVGLNGGYFTINELAPAAEFTHFYAYGPWFPALYGTLARIIGGSPTTILLINSLLVGLALILFCQVAALSETQLVITILMLATMWGLLLFFFTGMQEGFQQSIAILLTSFFLIALRQRNATTIKFRLIGLAVISFAAMTRLSWVILYVPFLLLTNKATLVNRIISLFISLILATGVLLFSNYTAAPGSSILTVLTAFKISFGFGLSNLVEYFLHNLGLLFSLRKSGTDIVQTYQVLVLIAALLVFVIQLYLRRKNQDDRLSEAKFHLYNLGVTVIASLALYIIGTGGDQRLLACHLMISLLIMICYKRYLPVVIIIGINIGFVSVFLFNFQSMTLTKFEPDHSIYYEFKSIADKYVPYDPNAKNAWCNTILFSGDNYDNIALDSLPGGIGLSFFYDPTSPVLTFKSRYLILEEEDYRVISERSNAPELTHLTDSPIGGLYLNQNADCPNSGKS